MSEISFDKYAVKGAYHWREYFGPIHRINAYTRARYRQVIAVLAAHQLPAGSHVLDAGCGDGALAGLIAKELTARVTGIDTAPQSIELAKQEFAKRGLNGEFHLIDGYEYPFGDETFSAIVCSEVIEHVREPKKMLLEMWRLLAPGGILVVTTPIRYTEMPLDRMHVQEWFPRAFREFCEGTLGRAVQTKLTHPVVFAELYASPHPLFGRIFRLTANVLSKCGVDLFAWEGFRAYSTQMAMAVKPAAEA